MGDRPTCGQGLAEHSVLPAKLGELTGAVAESLELHMKALDLADESSRREYATYQKLLNDHRKTATQLKTTAERMAGYRDLPMARHDPQAMADPKVRRAFETFVRLEQELIELLQRRLPRDRQLLNEMGTGPTGRRPT